MPETFPTVEDIRRLELIKKYSQLVDNEQYATFGLNELIKKEMPTLETIYVSHAIPDKICDFYGDFVQGDVLDMVIDSDGDEAEKQKVTDIVSSNDLKNSVYDYAYGQTAYGYVVLLGRIEDSKYIIDEVPQDQYFPQRDGSIILASYIKKPDAKTDKDLWLYKQQYKQGDTGNVVITRSLWEVDPSGYQLAQISLSAYDPDLLEEEKLDIEDIPIVRIDNSKKRKKFGVSDLHFITPQLAEINEKATQMSIQFLKNLSAKMTVPPELIDDAGNLKKFEAIGLENNDMVEPKYVINENPLLAECFTYIEKELNYISFITSVPLFELLSSSVIPERVGALKLRLFQAIMKTNSKRSEIMKGVQYIIQCGLKLQGIQDPSNIDIEFADVLPVDEAELVTVEESKLRNGLTSKRSAIKRLENYDDERVDEELRAIDNENKIEGINTNLPPQI